MGYFGNNRNVNFKILEESGIYSKQLLDQIRVGNYQYISEVLDISDRDNDDFMDPLLYAVKNEHGTYAIYKQYGENLQLSDLSLAIEVIVDEPELIEDTAVSNNRQFMRELAEVNPEVIVYMSSELKSDGKFINELCELNDDEITSYVTKECDISKAIEENPNLASDKKFMKEAIKEDAKYVEHISEELKDDYEFMKEACKENSKVISYMAENANNYGKNGLIAAKEVLTENTTCRAIDEMQAELEKIQAEKAEMESQEGFNKDSEEYKALLLRERHAKNGMKLMERIRNEKDPRRALKLIDMCCKNNLGEDYKQDLIKYFKLDDAVIEKERVEKLNINKKEILDNTTTKATNDFEEEFNTIQAEKEKMEAQKDFNKDSAEYKELLLRERHARNGMKLIERIKNEKDPRRAIEVVNMCCRSLGEEYREAFMQYIDIDDAIKITPNQIEEKTTNTRTSEINATTRGIREEYTEERGDEKVENGDSRATNNEERT